MFIFGVTGKKKETGMNLVRVNIGKTLIGNEHFVEFLEDSHRGYRCDFFAQECGVCEFAIEAYEMYGEVQVHGKFKFNTDSPEFIGETGDKQVVAYHRQCQNKLHDAFISKIYPNFSFIGKVVVPRSRIACVQSIDSSSSMSYFLFKRKLNRPMQTPPH